MASQMKEDMAVPASVAAGASLDVRAYTGRLIQLSGTFTATIQPEGSVEGTIWTAIGAAMTAPGYRVVEDGWRFVRMNTTAFTSGTPVAKFGGMV